MGLFDSILLPVKCPFCGEIVQSGQTKNLSNTLISYKVGDDTKSPFKSIRVLYVCESMKCRRPYVIAGNVYYRGRWFEIELELEKGRLTDKYKIWAEPRVQE